MDIWKVQFDERWSYHKKGEFEENTKRWTVGAKNMADAVVKASRLAMAQSCHATDDEGNELDRMLTVREVRPVYANLAEVLDA